jgi:hypothetical protein
MTWAVFVTPCFNFRPPSFECNCHDNYEANKKSLYLSIARNGAVLFHFNVDINAHWTLTDLAMDCRIFLKPVLKGRALMVWIGHFVANAGPMAGSCEYDKHHGHNKQLMLTAEQLLTSQGRMCYEFSCCCCKFFCNVFQAKRKSSSSSCLYSVPPTMNVFW